MNRLSSCSALITIFCTVLPAPPAAALDVPPLAGQVVDQAHVLPKSTVASMTAQLAAHESKSSNQVAVLIVPTLDGDIIEEFSHRVATAWKLGQKGTDNGVLLLVAIQERKVRIEVGYGLEGALTDARSAQIIRHEIVPRFRAGDLAGGVMAGVQAILRTIEGTYQASQASENTAPRRDNDVIGQVVTAVIVGLLVGLVFTNLHRFIGPVAGAGIATLLAPWWVPALAASGITLFLLLAIGASGTGGRNRSRGMDDWVWYSSRGGGWGGGSFGGGGGFSGGGGDFGGGGASGSW
ncbi:MAG: TPM domain-containing protein [Nitrospiraceae bacterium]